MRTRIIALPFLLLAATPALAQQQTVCPVPGTPGRQQSPIDIVEPVPARLDSVRTHYPAVPGRAFNTGQTIQVNVDPGSWLMVDGVRFALEEFHFHWPGEHTMMGDTFSVEIHMVHKADSHAAVVGTWVKIGAHNPAWNTLWANLPTGSRIFRMTVDVPRLFSLGSLNVEQVYRYCGSLTTGDIPSPEGITWLMRNHPIEMSRRQVEMLQAVMGEYSRDPQPLNGRPIRYWVP
jgi:carbonic anhydrase